MINNAAAFVFRSIEATAADWNRVLSVNVMGAAFCVKHVLPEMQQAGRGAIVNLASISGFIAEANSLTYSTSKAAILGLTRCMALDLAQLEHPGQCNRARLGRHSAATKGHSTGKYDVRSGATRGRPSPHLRPVRPGE